MADLNSILVFGVSLIVFVGLVTLVLMKYIRSRVRPLSFRDYFWLTLFCVLLFILIAQMDLLILRHEVPFWLLMSGGAGVGIGVISNHLDPATHDRRHL